MNKILMICIFILILNGFTFSNDTLFSNIAGGEEVEVQKNNGINLGDEKITIDLYKDHYHVKVDYDFRNNLSWRNVDMSFPEIEYNYATNEEANKREVQRNGKIYNFLSIIDGKEVKPISSDVDFKFKGYSNIKISRLYTRNVKFSPLQKVNIINEYDNTYGEEYYKYQVLYIFGTANAWGGIKHLEVSINIKDDSIWLFDDPKIGLARVIQPKSINNGSIKYKITGPSQSDYDIIQITPSWYGNGDIENIMDEHKVLTKDDIKYLTKNQIRIFRNMIYAFKGYVFTSDEMKNIFESMSWYKKDDKFTDAKLTAYEKALITFLQNKENNFK